MFELHLQPYWVEVGAALEDLRRLCFSRLCNSVTNTCAGITIERHLAHNWHCDSLGSLNSDESDRQRRALCNESNSHSWRIGINLIEI